MSREEQISPRQLERTSKYNKFSVKCRFCKSEEIVKRGLRKTKHRGKIQRWLCNNCDKSFTLDLGFLKMKNKENLITMAIDNYYENLSSRVVKKNFGKYSLTKISHQSVLNWIKKYAKKLKQFTDSLEPKLTGQIYLDETEIKCKKKDSIFWCAIDGNTKYIVASHYTLNPQNVNDAMKVLKDIKQSQLLKFVQTDAAVFYPMAMRKVFYSRYKKDRIEHKIINTSKTGTYNVKIERFFRNLKERTKLMYGFKNFNSAKLTLDGYTVWYNFIREHMTLKKTPAEASGLSFGLGINKLWGLIILSTIYT